MRTPYPEWNYKGSDPIAQAATKLYQARQIPTRLSPLVFMTDPKRVPDVLNAVKNLPEGVAVIYRHFGRDNRYKIGLALREITEDRGQQLLIGRDSILARDIGADGVHFPRSQTAYLAWYYKKNNPDKITTMAAVKAGDYVVDIDFLDGLFLSSIFPSKSPSAGPPIGIQGLKDITKDYFNVPIFALGGVNAETAQQLIGSGAAGLAAIGGLLPKSAQKPENFG